MNHFIEVQKGIDGTAWVMIHSGSRNLGKQVADYYNKVANGLNEKYFSSVPSSYGLAFLPHDSDEGQMYLTEMNACLDFARWNRHYMMLSVLEVINNYLSVYPEDLRDVHHNYASIENHFGKNVMIHRKGATSAKKNQLGIIPGSQGTASYIVKGMGNPHSFTSCSHGAGRQMGRKDAQRRLDLATQKKILDDQGIIHTMTTKASLEEAPGAYKDISVVMENQKDLVSIVEKLTPLAVVKG